jgi:hypothetical protein
VRGIFDDRADREADLRSRESRNARDFRDRDERDRGGDRDRDGWSRAASRIRNDWSRRDRNDLPFRFGWWNNYRNDRWPVYSPWAFSRWRNQPYYWWGWTPATQLTTWFAFDGNRPRYWAYGPGANIYYQGDYVFYDGEQYLPVNDYYQRIYDLAHSVPSIDAQAAENIDWAPLGVFALTRGSEYISEPQRTLQIAVNRQGVLTGTYYNAENGHVHPVAGMVDNRTQRAAWAFADGEHAKIVFETSVFNFTKPDATMMVHFGPATAETEVWRMVRLESPEAENAGTSTPQQLVPTNELP